MHEKEEAAANENYFGRIHINPISSIIKLSVIVAKLKTSSSQNKAIIS